MEQSFMGDMMAKKKSIKLSVGNFKNSVTEIENFLDSITFSSSEAKYTSWAFDAAVIRLFRSFETLMLDTIVGTVNKDTSCLSNATGVLFPKHLPKNACEYLITGGGYFDFKGRDGLIKVICEHLGTTHAIHSVVKKSEYKNAIEQLCALRNFAAHNSAKSKRAALKSIGASNMSSAGAWLKVGSRFDELKSKFVQLANEIEELAPF